MSTMPTTYKLIIEIDPKTASIKPKGPKLPRLQSRPGEERYEIWQGLVEYCASHQNNPMPVCEFIDMARKRAPKHLQKDGLEDIKIYLERQGADLFGAVWKAVKALS